MPKSRIYFEINPMMACVWKRRPKTYNLFKTKIEIGQVPLVVDSAAGESW